MAQYKDFILENVAPVGVRRIGIYDENGIHLRGRDFVKGEFLPIASYWLDTTLKTVAAGTYTDPTGTITTG